MVRESCTQNGVSWIASVCEWDGWTSWTAGCEEHDDTLIVGTFPGLLAACGRGEEQRATQWGMKGAENLTLPVGPFEPATRRSERRSQVTCGRWSELYAARETLSGGVCLCHQGLSCMRRGRIRFAFNVDTFTFSCSRGETSDGYSSQ